MEATRVISKEFNFSDCALERIRSMALRTVFCVLMPKTVALMVIAKQKKVHPVFWVSRLKLNPVGMLKNPPAGHAKFAFEL
jgi:hypothetical protein